MSETSYDETMKSMRQAHRSLDEIYSLLMDVQYRTDDFAGDKFELCNAVLQHRARLVEGLVGSARKLASSAWKLKGAN